MGEPRIKRLIRPEQLAEALAVDIQWVYSETRSGKIPKVPNMGRLIRYSPETIKKTFNIEIEEN